MEPALTTGGVGGVIMIVVCFYAWFFLSKLPRLPMFSVSLTPSSHRHSCVYGRYQCHVALAPSRMG